MRQIDVIRDALDELDPAVANVYRMVRGVTARGDDAPAPRHTLREVERLTGRSYHQVRDYYRDAEKHVLRHLAYAWRREAGGTDLTDLEYLDDGLRPIGHKQRVAASKKGTHL
jgi:hypothetical protein